MLRRERIGGQPAQSRLLLSALYRLHLLRSEIAIASVDLARLGLVTLALGLQTAVLYSPGHFRPATDAFFVIFVPLGTLVSLALCLTATLPSRRFASVRLRRAIGIFAFAALPILAITGFTSVQAGFSSVLAGTPYANDGAAMDQYAAQQVLHGEDPYQEASIVQALAGINAPATTVTPLVAGQFRGTVAYPSDSAIQSVFLNVQRHQPGTIPPEFESKYNYPAGSFLFILPFLWAGVHDMRFLYALAILAMGWYLASRMPYALRPLVPLLILADVPLMALTAGGQPDPIYGLFLLIGYAEWRAPKVSPALMGLAIATKQLAWFFIPFYLLLIVREHGWREAMRRSGIMVGVFLLLNGVFIVQSPRGYVTSIAGPMTDPMFPLGIGVIALFVSNLLPMIAKVAFTAAELAVWAAGLAANIRFRAFAPAAGVVLGALPLFFAWRSLVNYFYLVPLLTLAVVFAGSLRKSSRNFASARAEGMT